MAEPLPPRKRFGTNHRPVETRPSETSDDPWLRRADIAFQASTSFIDTNLRQTWEASIAHFQNRHMPGSKYHNEAYKYRSKLFRPKTRSSVRQVEAATAAAFFSQLEVMTVEPVDDSDPMQEASAALRHELLNYRLSGYGQIPWFQTCVGAMQEAQVYGIVVSKQFWDFAEEEINVPLGANILDSETGQPATTAQKLKTRDKPGIKLYPIENIRFDPAADWTDVVNTSPYFIAMETMRIAQVKEKISTGEWETVPDNVLLTARNAVYDSTRQARSGETEDPKDPRYSRPLEDYDLVWVHENFMVVGGIDIHYYTLGTVARLSKPRPIKAVYLHNQRPFVVGTCVIEPHKAHPNSPVDLGKGLQKEANEVVNSRLDNVKLVLNKRWFVKRGRQVDLQSLVRNAPGSATLMNDPTTDVVPQEFADVTGSSYAEQDRINVDYDELAGSFSTGSVATNRKLGETVGGLQMLRGTSNTMAQYVIRIFSETWVEKVLHQLDALEQHYESDIELLTLMARRANLEKWGIQAVTEDLLMAPARVSVNVANSAQDPTVRLELFTYAMRTYAEFRNIMPPDIDPEPVKQYLFGLLGFRDASRFTVDHEGNPEIAMRDQMIQQLQQALESKMMEMEKKNEPIYARIQADMQKLAMQLDSDQRITDQQEDNRLIITKLTEATKVLLANMSSDTDKMDDETKRYIADLEADVDRMIARTPSAQGVT